MATWYAQASGAASAVGWNIAAGGGGNALTWPPSQGDTLDSNQKSVSLDADPGDVTLAGAGWHVSSQVSCTHGLTLAGTVNIDSGGALILGVANDSYPWTLNGTVNVNDGGRLRLAGSWTINGSVAVFPHGTLEVLGASGTLAASGALVVAADAQAFTLGAGLYALHANSTVTLFGYSLRPAQPIPTAQEIWEYPARSLTDRSGFSLSVPPPTVEQIATRVGWDLGTVHGWDLWGVDMQAELAKYHAATREEVAAVKARTDLIPAQPAAVGSPMTLADGALTAASIADGAINSAKFTVGAVGGPAAGILEQVRQLWRRFFKQSTMTASQLKTYADDGITVVTTQALSDDGVTQTQGAAQ